MDASLRNAGCGHEENEVLHLSADICTQVTCVQRYKRMLAAINQVHEVQLQQRIHRVLLQAHTTLVSFTRCSPLMICGFRFAGIWLAKRTHGRLS